MEREDLDVKQLQLIPLTIAAWIRYLLGIDDNGNAMDISPDPLLGEIQQQLATLQYGNKESVGNVLRPLLSNLTIFVLDLYQAGLGERIEEQVKALIAGNGAVRSTRKNDLGREGQTRIWIVRPSVRSNLFERPLESDR